MLMLGVGPAWASGPRWVTGYPYYQTQGLPVVWAQSKLMYFTDPGGLGAAVDHGAADALVAAAAGVWNVPVASITVGQGGELAEHVSGANVYLGTDGLVFPADVGSGNSAAVPVAVVYDTDGSVTDLLLGQGASTPASCRQNGVTESVDEFSAAGYIQHAIVVVNGRCSGAAPELQLQLQYQLERAFGRVLGLAWSQTNDNVFTGTPQPTYEQAMHWPILHPLDLICGPYTYQCFPSPFTLRPDDVAGMVLLYPNAVGSTPAAGKVVSLGQAEGVFGEVDFPTGQGMAGVNILAQRQGAQNGALEPWVEASAVTGTRFRRNGASPFVGKDGSATGSEGSNDVGYEGKYYVAYLPLQEGTTQQTVVVSTEAVNPLYTGTHSVEPYAAGAVTPSGTPPPPVVYPQATNNGDTYAFFTVADAAASCGNGLDGTAAAPVAVDGSGFEAGLICGYGHAAYGSLNVRPGRTLTVEVTGLDEQGYATTGKLMPVIGIYAPGDAGLPSVGVEAGAFNALGLGTTRLVAATVALTQVKIGVADQRGDGRPDFAYEERVFYADSVSPARLPMAGGVVAVSGVGFRSGNAVLVNGVRVVASGWTANAITVAVPAMGDVGASDKVAVDVEVMDLSTGAVSTMMGALMYDSRGGAKGMKLVSAPGTSGFVGSPEAVGFGVQVVEADGVTGVAGETVVFSATAGGGMGLFSVCGAATCAVTTDANGMAATGITPLVAGTTTLVAADGALSETASFSASAADASMVVVSAPSGSLPNRVTAVVPFAVKVLAANGTGVGGRLVTFTVSNGSASYGGCSAATCGVVTRSDGTAAVTVTPTAVGAVTLTATDGALQQSASFVSADSTDVMLVTTALGATALTGGQDPFAIRLVHADGVTPDAGERVVFTVTGGATLAPCRVGTCAQTTGASGGVGVIVESLQAGTFTVQAAFGTVTQTATVTFSVGQPQLILISAPTGVQRVGVAANQAFSVRLLAADGTPIVGEPLPMSGPLDEERLGACRLGGCLLTTDANGVASSTVIPIKAGPVLVTAQYGSLSQQIRFSAVAETEIMTVVASPGTGTYTGDPESFTVQVMEPDGVTPAVGDTVAFSVTQGSFAFTGCAATACPVTTDALGQATIGGMALRPGNVQVKAADGAVSQTMSFSTMARPDVMKLVSAPTGSVLVGTAAGVPFAVQVMLADGVTPAVGRSITFAVTVGTGRFSACAVAPCVVRSDARGMASVMVTPLVAGTVSVVAADGAASETASVTGMLPDVLSVVEAPVGTMFLGSTAAVPLKVKLTLADGATAVSGVQVTFSNSGVGAVIFAACGTPVCVVTTDAAGVANTDILGTGVGAAVLVASAAEVGAESVSVTLEVVPDQESLVAQDSELFIAEGVSFSKELSVLGMYNLSPAVGLPVAWTGTGGATVEEGSSVTDLSGMARIGVTLGPLAGEQAATVTACAWVGADCTQFTARGVAMEALRLVIVSGGEQMVPAAGDVVPVVGQVVDGAGDGVAGAAVSVYQMVTAGAPCPARGRCPAAPVLATGSSVTVADAAGMVLVSPQTLSGGEGYGVRMLLTVGTAGSGSAVVWVEP